MDRTIRTTLLAAGIAVTFSLFTSAAQAQYGYGYTGAYPYTYYQSSPYAANTPYYTNAYGYTPTYYTSPYYYYNPAESRAAQNLRQNLFGVPATSGYDPNIYDSADRFETMQHYFW